ncbi:MAG: hexitol phosphatase HxpB [Acidimicrobiales bacterium]
MITTAIFDMDGLLTESESRWRIAEREAVARLGIPLTDADFELTMGVRMRDVAQRWFEWHPWEGPTPDEVATQVIDRVIELGVEAQPLPGVEACLAFLANAGIRLALCSSSDMTLIDATLKALDLEDVFDVVHSAETDEHGKPHPQPYLATAATLGVTPHECLVFEDSLSGCVSGKAAGMKVVAVPDAAMRGSGQFSFADLVLDSLDEFDASILATLNAGTPTPSVSRPRFHLAFGVDDLAAARAFYGGVLNCREGRSADTWVDFDLWGHQIVAHLDASHDSTVSHNPVDGKTSTCHHFGLLLHPSAWRTLVARPSRQPRCPSSSSHTPVLLGWQASSTPAL